MSEDDPTRQRPPDSGGSADWTPAGDAPDAVTAELGAPEEKLSKKERKAREKAAKRGDAGIQAEGAVEAETEREKAEREARERREQADAEARRALEAGQAAAARMREQARAPEPEPVVSGARLTSPGVGAESPPRAQAAASEGASAAGERPPRERAEPLAPGERPEVLVGAAFAGAFLFAKLLKRMSRR